jgi:hypothetical protein
MKRAGAQWVRRMCAWWVAAIFCLALAGEGAAQVPQVKIGNPGMGHPTLTMGDSVAVDGDTMVVGAPNSYPYSFSGAGLARVYRSDGQGGWRLKRNCMPLPTS